MKIGDKIYCIKPLSIEYSKTMTVLIEIDDEYVLNEFGTGADFRTIKNDVHAFLVTPEELNEHFATAAGRRKLKLQKIMNHELRM